MSWQYSPADPQSELDVHKMQELGSLVDVVEVVLVVLEVVVLLSQTGSQRHPTQLQV